MGNMDIFELAPIHSVATVLLLLVDVGALFIYFLIIVLLLSMNIFLNVKVAICNIRRNA